VGLGRAPQGEYCTVLDPLTSSQGLNDPLLLCSFSFSLALDNLKVNWLSVVFFFFFFFFFSLQSAPGSPFQAHPGARKPFLDLILPKKWVKKGGPWVRRRGRQRTDPSSTATPQGSGTDGTSTGGTGTEGISTGAISTEGAATGGTTEVGANGVGTSGVGTSAGFSGAQDTSAGGTSEEGTGAEGTRAEGTRAGASSGETNVPPVAITEEGRRGEAVRHTLGMGVSSSATGSTRNSVLCMVHCTVQTVPYNAVQCGCAL